VFDGPPRAKVALKAYPNPFNPRTTVAFSLTRRQMVEISIFDLTGRQVRTLAARLFQAGDHTLEWNGRDDAGRPLGSGSYLVRLRTDFEIRTKKVMLIK
jgi:flagellar hook assembly protein FlgD